MWYYWVGPELDQFVTSNNFNLPKRPSRCFQKWNENGRAAFNGMEKELNQKIEKDPGHMLEIRKQYLLGMLFLICYL